MRKNKLIPPKNTREFNDRFSSEADCRNYLEEIKGFFRSWPCPDCKGRIGKINNRRLRVCKNCKHQASLFYGTIFHRSKTPLTKWFKAFWLFCASESTNAIQLQKTLNIEHKTALHILRKIRTLPSKLVPGRVGSSQVEIINLEKPRASIIIAIERQLPGVKYGTKIEYGTRIRCKMLDSVDSKSIINFRDNNIVKGSDIEISKKDAHLWPDHDGYSMIHTIISTSEGEIVFTRIKQIKEEFTTWLAHNFSSRVSTKHLPLYLDEFVFKYNPKGCYLFLMSKSDRNTAPDQLPALVKIGNDLFSVAKEENIINWRKLGRLEENNPLSKLSFDNSKQYLSREQCDFITSKGGHTLIQNSKRASQSRLFIKLLKQALKITPHLVLLQRKELSNY